MRFPTPPTAVRAATLAAVVAGAVVALLISLALDDDGVSLDEVRTTVEAAVADAFDAQDDELRIAAERVIPGIVQVLVVVEDDDGAIQQGLGTGLIMDADGHIITNQHVIRGADLIEVILQDGSVHEARLISSDIPFNDIAVIQIDATGLTPVPFGTSSSVRLGDLVLAIGMPIREDETTVTAGVVSSANTTIPNGDQILEHMIQSDAALNVGSSGGALVNRDGEVIGLTTSRLRGLPDGSGVDGIGFAIQIDEVLEVVRGIIADGSFPRPYLGVVDLRTINDFVQDEFGLPVDTGTLLVEITQSGALADAGIRPGDILLKLGGLGITPELPYFAVLRRVVPGEPVELVYLQRGDNTERTVTITPTLYQR